MAWKITTKTFTAGESPWTYNSAGDHTDLIVQATSGTTTVKGSVDGTNLSAELRAGTTANTPYLVTNFPYVVFTNASGDTVIVAERVKDPS